MNIYEIDSEILTCFDEETGEIIDIEKLESLTIERDRKIDGITSWYKQLTAEALAIKAERESLYTRQVSKEKQADSLKKYLSDILNGQKFETPRHKLSWRKSTGVNITNADLIPSQFYEIVEEKKINKSDIKKAISIGIEVDGAEIYTNNNLQIK